MDIAEKRPHKQTSVPETERWVLLDSKSNPGRKYYYNPVTKQKLWHYTDEEIKKKEKKNVEVCHQTNVNTQPNVPKRDEASSSAPTIINSVHPNNPVNPWNVPLIPSQLPYTIPLIPQNIPTAFINNPFLCNQIASQAAFINFQSSAPTTINQMQNITRFEMNSDISKQQAANEPGTDVQKCATSNEKSFMPDLRNKLIKKKHSKPHIHNKRNINHSVIEEIQENVSWSEELVKHILTYFKAYISPNTKPDMWYIVPETNVILRHSRLLNLMRLLDDKCNLIIPLFVRKELKPIENIPGNEAIGRLIRFSLTSAGADKLSENTDNRFYNILNTCRNLTADKYHVVLLCDNDQSFKHFKSKIDIPVFTVEKIIQLHYEGRLIPRHPITSLKTEIVSKEPTSNDIQKDNKVTSDAKISEQCGSVKNENISTSDNPNTSKPSKRRLINLNATYDENPKSGQPSKRRRWSTIKNKCQGSSSTTLQTLSNKKCDDVLSNVHQDNSKSQATTDEVDSPIVALSKQQSGQCVTITNVESAATNYINHEEINSDSKDKNMSSGDQNFLQIMINVLLKVLQQDPIVIEKEMQQLQRLYEAALDIIKNFIQYGLIVDAANKLSMKITQATKDEIKTDQQFYDDIHSYGVNLLKTLQDKCPCPVDIQNALNLLENERDKLSLDACCNNLVDVTKDQHQEVVSNNDMKDTGEKSDTEITDSIAELTPGEESTSDVEKDKDNTCLTNKRRLENPTDSEDVYFTALKLRKTEKEHVENNNVSDICVHGKNTEKQGINIVEGKCLPLDKPPKDSTLETEDSINGCGEGNTKPLHIVDDNVCNMSFEDDNESMETDNKNISFDEQIIESQNFIDENESKDMLKATNVNNEQFKHFVGMFLKEVREALLICVHNFEICVTHQDVNNDLSGKFRKVRVHLYNIRRSLDSILQRDTNDVNNNFKSLLNKAGVDIEVDQSVCDQYREIVHKYRNEVDAFLTIMGRTIYDQNCDEPLLSPQCV